jgi:hypothetical protein
MVGDGSSGFYGTGTINTPGLDLDGRTTSVLGSQDILLARWDEDGNAIWARTAGGVCGLGSEFDIGGRIAYDPTEQRVVISGRYDCPFTYFGDHLINGSADDRADMFVASYDASGECLWARGTRGPLGSREILIDDESSLHVFGQNSGTVTFQGTSPVTVLPGGFIAKYDPDGELRSAERVLLNGEMMHASWVSSNEWVIGGFLSSSAELYGQPIPLGSPTNDGFVARTTTDGTISWVTSFRSSVTAQVWECAATLTGQINIAGHFTDSLFLANDTLIGPPGIRTFFLASLSPTNGEVQWAVPISSPTQVFVYDLKIGPDNDLYTFGRFKGPLTLGSKVVQPTNATSGFAARFSPTGECVGAWAFGRIQSGTKGSVLPMDYGVVIACDYDSAMVVGTEVVPVTQIDFADLFIAKFDSLSGFTGVQAFVPEGESGLHIYANPSNGLCTVELPNAITAGSDLVLTIFDAQGRVVQQAPLRMHQGTVELDIQAQAKGIYHVELQDGNRRYTGRIVFE